MRRLSFYVMTLVLLVSAAGLAACDDTSESPGTDPTPTGQAQPAEREYDLDVDGQCRRETAGRRGHGCLRGSSRPPTTATLPTR